MNAYSGMIVSILILCLFIRPNGIKTHSVYSYLACFIMFIVMGCRDAFTIGYDSISSYVVLFNSMADKGYHDLIYDTENYYNIGFRVFMKFLYELTKGDYQLFVLILSGIIMLSFAHFIGRYSISPVQSVCYYCGLLYFTFMISAEKQALAMAILLFAFDAAIDKKLIRFLLLTILAALIHFPALVFLPAYLLAQLEMERGYLLVMSGFLAVTFMFRAQILQLMMKAYGNETENISMDGIVFFRNKVIIMILIIVAALYFRPAKRQNRVYKTLLLFMLMAVVFQTFCGYNNIFERLADYYFQYAIIFIPMVFEFPRESVHNLDRGVELMIKAYAPLVFCVFAIWRFLTYVQGQEHLFPYRFFFK